MAKGKYKQGRYRPKNSSKYVGNVDNIVFRSSWELQFFKFCDTNPNVLRWNSEGIAIPYVKRTTGRVHRYYPDVFIEYKDKHGKILKELIEIKPLKETKPSRAKKHKQRLYENLTYSINQDKWTAAVKWCRERGIKFRILTEEQLFKK